MIALGIFFGLLLLIILLLPFLLDLNRYRDQYLPVLEETLDRSIDVEDIRLTLFPTLGVQLRNVAIADDPTFSPQPFMTVPSIQVAVQWRPLLEQRVQVESVFIEDPVVQVIRSPAGTLNTATIGKVSPAPKPGNDNNEPQGSVSPLLGVLAVEQFTMTGGILNYEDRRHQPSQTHQIRDLELKTQSVAVGQTAQIGLQGMVMPYQVPIDINGRFGPIQANLNIPEVDINGQVNHVVIQGKGDLTDGQLTLDVQVPKASTKDVPLNLGLEKPIAISELQAHLVARLFHKEPSLSTEELSINSLDANLHLGQSTIHLTGKGTPTHFSLVGNTASLASTDLPVAIPLEKPVLFEHVEFEAELHEAILHLQSLKTKVFDGTVLAQGRLDQTGPPFSFSTQGTFKDFSIDSLANVLRPSSVSMTGAGDLVWKINGVVAPSQPLQVDGPTQLTLRKGEVVGFDLIKVVEDALQMSGMLGEATGATQFSLIDAKTELEKDGLAIRELLADAPNFSLRSVGKLGLDHTLNFQGRLGVPQTLADKIISRFPMAKAVRQQGQLILPFLVKGTVQDPVFRLDTRSLGDQLRKNVEKRLQKVLQGDDQELENLVNDGKDLLRQFFRK